MKTCDLCGESIKGKYTIVRPAELSLLSILLGLDKPFTYHNACYEKIEQKKPGGQIQ